MTTIQRQVGAGVDDADEKQNGASFLNAEATLSVSSYTSDSFRYNIGLRFTNVTAGQADTIDSADVELYADSATSDNANFDIHAHAHDNAPNFTDTADVTSRARTSASVLWSEANLGVGWTTTCPESKSVLQEVVDRGGWASGQAMVMILAGLNAAWQFLRITSYDGNASLAAKLNVTFTGGGGGAVYTSNRLLRGHGI